MAAPGAFTKSVKGVSAIVHTASDMTFGPDPRKPGTRAPSTEHGPRRLMMPRVHGMCTRRAKRSRSRKLGHLCASASRTLRSTVSSQTPCLARCWSRGSSRTPAQMAL
jgi:hypothetical protein